MSSPLSNLHFRKIDDKTCEITCSLAGQFSQINDTLSKENRATTALIMLCELLEINKVSCTLLKELQQDLNLPENKRSNAGTLVSDYFFEYHITEKYVASCEEIFCQEETFYSDVARNLQLSEQKEDALWADIFQNAEHSFYKPTKDSFGEDEMEEFERISALRHEYWGNMNLLQHLELLERHLLPAQIGEIWPRQVFLLTFKSDYLKGIEELESHQTASDAHICRWLDRL